MPAGRPVAVEGDVADTILDDMAPHLGRTALRRELAPAFDERFDAAEDIEWWLRLAQTDGVTVTTVRRIGYLVRRHEGERTRTGLSSRVAPGSCCCANTRTTSPRTAVPRAFAWKRIGLMAATYGDRAMARRAYARPFLARPDPKTFGHAVTAVGRSTRTIEDPT